VSQDALGDWVKGHVVAVPLAALDRSRIFGDTDIYHIDVIRGRLEVPDLQRQSEAVHLQYRLDETIIEETDIGRALFQELRRHSLCRPIMWRPQFDKTARLLAQSPKFEIGQVLLPRGAPWLADYVAELLAFPNGLHDDQVDSTSQALNWLPQETASFARRTRPNPPRPQGDGRRPNRSAAQSTETAGAAVRTMPLACKLFHLFDPISDWRTRNNFSHPKSDHRGRHR